MTRKKSLGSMEDYITEIRKLEIDANHLRRSTERELKKLKPLLIGIRIRCDWRGGKQKGDYQITEVSLGWDGTLEISGRKFLASDKVPGSTLLGRQSWELGKLTVRRLQESIVW